MEGLLFLDDDRSQMVLYSHFTKKYFQGYPAFFAETVPEAEEILKHNAIKLAVVDLMIPTENGADLILKMKSHSSSAGIKIIVVTSAREGTLIHNVLKDIVDSFVTKPIDMKNLADLVKEKLKEE